MYYESTRKVRHFRVKILTYKEACVCTEAYIYSCLAGTTQAILSLCFASWHCWLPLTFCPTLTSNRIIVVAGGKGGGGLAPCHVGGISSGCD
jgi:hypothetical protein